MKSAALTLIFILITFATFGYALSELATALRENARLVEQLKIAQAGQTAGQVALTAANAETALALTKLQVYQQFIAKLATENAMLEETVHTIEATEGDVSGLDAGPLPACPNLLPEAGKDWKPLLQPTVTLIFAIVLGLARHRTSPTRLNRRNSPDKNA